MATPTEQLQQLYVAYFNRPADVDGLNYWLNALANGGTVAQVSAAFAVQPEYTSVYGGKSASEVIDTVYMNLFGRHAEQGGLDYWGAILQAHPELISSIVTAIVNGAKNEDGTPNSDGVAYNDKVAAAGLFTAELQTVGNEAERIAYAKGTTAVLTIAKDFIASVHDDATLATATAGLHATAQSLVTPDVPVGTTYLLTAGIDTIPGTTGNDIINAVQTDTTGSFFGGLDTINGGAGADTLNVQDNVAAGATFSFNGAAIQNVEVLNLATAGDLLGLDLTGLTGLTTATLAENGVGHNSTGIKLASTTAATISAAGLNNNVSVVAGGTTLKITTNGTGTIAVGAAGAGNVDTSATALTLKTGSGTVGAFGSALTSVTVNGGGQVTIDNTKADATSAGGTTLTTVVLNNDAATAAIKGAALTNVTLSTQGTAGTARLVTVSNATAAHTLNVTAAGTGFSAAGVDKQTQIFDAAAKNIAVTTTADSSLELGDDSTANAVLTGVTATGSGALTLNLDSTRNTAVTSFNGSAATGDISLQHVAATTTTIKTGAGADDFTVTATTAVTVDAGAGNDTVTLGAIAATGSTIALGAGNDKLLGVAAAAPAASATSVIDGGAGTDTVSADLINAGNAAMFKNFEVLSLNSSTGLDLALLTGNSINALSIDTVTTNATYQNVTASGVTVSFADVSDAGYVATTATDNSTHTNTLQLSGVTGTSDAFAINFTSTGGTTAPVAVTTNAGTIVAAGIENFTIASGGVKAWNALTLGADTSANKVTITGDQGLTLAFAAGFGSVTTPKTGVTLIDGSTATGDLAIDTTNVVAATAGLTVNTGAGADTLTVTQTGSTISTGAGNDTVVLTGAVAATVNLGAGNDIITLGTSAVTVTGGAGSDTIDAHLAVSASLTAPVFTTFTDAASTDVIKLTAAGTAVFTSVKVDVSTATALFGGTVNALDLASTPIGSVNNQVTWFQYGGNTYVVDHTGAAAGTFATTDQVVKLVGLIDLSHAAWVDGGATGTLTLA